MASAARKSINEVVDQETGEFKRPAAHFRSFISTEPGAEFPPEKGRYHLYVSYACPWAHRTLVVRKLKSLEDIIGFNSVHWFMDLNDKGWRFATEQEALSGPNTTPDPINDAKFVRDLYFLADAQYSGRFSVPVLWDTKKKTIVSNESSEIIRMFGTAFDSLLDEDHKNIKLVPQKLEKTIDEINSWIYDDINNGVYKCGVAQNQEAYENAVIPLFESLDRVEDLLSKSSGRYVLGSTLTEVDVRLYPTIVRFDIVYVSLFKTNIKTIRTGYPFLHKWLQHLYYDLPAFQDTTNFEHIKKHYFTSLTPLNPSGVVPLGPLPNIEKPV